MMAGLLFCTKLKQMQQHFDRYKKEDHRVWGVLFERQVRNLEDKASSAFLDCLLELEPVLHAELIPDFNLLNAALIEKTGWQIEVVPGHIPVRDFLSLLSERKFPASTWLRSMEQLDYLEEPDMFHDVFGHIPLLMDEAYAQFMHEFGRIGMRWSANDQAIQSLRSLYWFTIEFGLTENHGNRGIYGAGILSSFGESKQVFEDQTQVFPFELDAILSTEFRTDVMQNQYFACKDLNQFLSCLPESEELLTKAEKENRHKPRPGAGR